MRPAPLIISLLVVSLNQYRDGENTNLEASKPRARLTKSGKIGHERNAQISFIGVLSCSGDLQKCSLNPGAVS